MNITVLPYIDASAVKQNENIQPSASSTDTTKDFSVSLEAAQKAIAAITVDLLVSQDTEKIHEAAAILKSSAAPKLQELGQELLTSLEAAEKKDESAETTSTVSSNPVSVNTSDSDNSTDTTTSNSVQNTSAASDTAAETSAKVSSDAAAIASALGCPENLQPYFEEAAETYGVDIALLESIAKAESNYRADAVSSAGAIGIMQLMPATASGLKVEDSYDAYQNIMGGAKLISQLLEKYDGNTSLALAAYNAGSGNVDKYGGIPPFEETQNYVTKVLGYYKQQF